MRNYILPVLFVLPFLLIGQKTTISLTARTPYCGGAKPTPEMALGTVRGLVNQVLVINYRKLNAKPTDKWLSLVVTLDSNGKWKGKIPKKSEITIYLAEQLLSLSELKTKYVLSDLKNYALKEDAAIELWKSEPIYKNSIKTCKKNLEIEILEKCFLGLNPCYQYIGPKPR